VTGFLSWEIKKKEENKRENVKEKRENKQKYKKNRSREGKWANRNNKIRCQSYQKDHMYLLGEISLFYTIIVALKKADGVYSSIGWFLVGFPAQLMTSASRLGTDSTSFCRTVPIFGGLTGSSGWSLVWASRWL
jgi:hypothetical protein